MAKNKRDSKVGMLDTRNGKGLQVVQSEEHDDTPLPSPEDLAKYKELEPNIINWLMKVSEKEQDHRHGIEQAKIDNIKDVNKKLYTHDMYRVTCALLVVVLVLGVSCFLIYTDKDIIGSIFGGGIILGAVAMFLNFRNNKPEAKKADINN